MQDPQEDIRQYVRFDHSSSSPTTNTALLAHKVRIDKQIQVLFMSLWFGDMIIYITVRETNVYQQITSSMFYLATFVKRWL